MNNSGCRLIDENISYEACFSMPVTIFLVFGVICVCMCGVVVQAHINISIFIKAYDLYAGVYSLKLCVYIYFFH